MSKSVEDDEEAVGDFATTETEGNGEPAEALDEELEAGDDESDLAVASRQLEELNERHLRLVAEFTNFRRRVEQERLSAWGRAQADVIAKFLDVLDDLHRVAQLDLGNASVDAIMEGVDLVERKFSRMLEDAGVGVIDPVGERFDPQTMEGIMRVPAESPEQDETVAQVMQKGYTLKGALMRPARVAVYKHG